MANYIVTAEFPAPRYNPDRPVFDYERGTPLGKPRVIGRPYTIQTSCGSARLAKDVRQVFDNLGATTGVKADVARPDDDG